jgi:hypothetical protein
MVTDLKIVSESSAKTCVSERILVTKSNKINDIK